MNSGRCWGSFVQSAVRCEGMRNHKLCATGPSWGRKGPTLANPVLAILIWPIWANPILAKPFLAIVVLARPMLAKTNFGQFKLFPILWANPILPIQFWPIHFWIWCVCHGGWKFGAPKNGARRVRHEGWGAWGGVGPERWGPEGWGPEGCFFSVSCSHFRSFCLSLGVFSWFLVVFGSAGAVKCARLEFSGCRVKPRNVACLLDLTNTSPWWLRLLGDDCSSS